MPSEDVYSDDWWLDRNDQNRCVAHRKNGERCLKPAIRGATVCRTHGGAAPQVVAKAQARLANEADNMAKGLIDMAKTAQSEAVKLKAHTEALDRAGVVAKTEVTVSVKAPWERMMGDLSGVANISRAEHRALQGRPFVEAIDVEVVEPADESDPARAPESRESEMPDPGANDVPGGDMPRGTGALMTLEDAAEANDRRDE